MLIWHADNIVKALSDELKKMIFQMLWLRLLEKHYAETNHNGPWGDVETTYLTADGEILGYSHQWGDVNSGEYGIGYNDAEWNHLGSFYNDQYGSGF